MLTSSGQAASLMSVLNIARSGDHIICPAEVYGGTFNPLTKPCARWGIDVTFISVDADEKEIQAAFRFRIPQLISREALSNPELKDMILSSFVFVAHKNGVPLIVDNTFPTRINCRPFEFGADNTGAINQKDV